MKVMTVVGTRPEIIRLAAVMRRLDATDGIEHVLVHTGQNWDRQLNGVFFDDLGLRLPDDATPAVETPAADISASGDRRLTIRIGPLEHPEQADGIVAAVSHQDYGTLSVTDIGRKLVQGGVFIDVKAAFDNRALTSAGFRVWRL